MVQGVTSSVIPNIAYYSQVAEASMYLTNVMNEAMLLKSRLGSEPLMDAGTSKTLNALA
jgi:hypothetical protein